MRITTIDKISIKDRRFFEITAHEWIVAQEQEARVALMHEMLGYAQALANMKVIPEYDTVQLVFHFVDAENKKIKGGK